MQNTYSVVVVCSYPLFISEALYHIMALLCAYLCIYGTEDA